MDFSFITQWLDTLPWYIRWLSVALLVTFGVVLVKGLATMLAEAILAFIMWLVYLPVRLVEKLFKKDTTQEGLIIERKVKVENEASKTPSQGE